MKIAINDLMSTAVYFQACASESCNKKVVDNGDGSYRCEKCNKTSPSFKHRLLLQVHLCVITPIMIKPLNYESV